MKNIEDSLKKMALVLDKVVKKIDELEKRVEKLEKKESKDTSLSPSNQVKSESKNSSGFGGSFLGSLAGAVAGMGLYNLLFNHNVSAADFANKLGVSEDEIEDKLEDIDEKLEDIDKELEELAADIEPFEDDISDEDFENMSLDDYLAQEDDFDMDDFGDV